MNVGLSCILGVLMLAGSVVHAQSIMDAEAFDAHVTGRTITFSSEGDPTYGVERYLPGRRVMWSRFDGICQYGVWFESKGDICFRYEGDPESKCWTIYDEPGGIRGVYTTRPPYTVIYEEPEREAPLICNDLSS